MRFQTDSGASKASSSTRIKELPPAEAAKEDGNKSFAGGRYEEVCDPRLSSLSLMSTGFTTMMLHSDRHIHICSRGDLRVLDMLRSIIPSSSPVVSPYSPNSTGRFCAAFTFSE